MFVALELVSHHLLSYRVIIAAHTVASTNPCFYLFISLSFYTFSPTAAHTHINIPSFIYCGKPFISPAETATKEGDTADTADIVVDCDSKCKGENGKCAKNGVEGEAVAGLLEKEGSLKMSIKKSASGGQMATVKYSTEEEDTRVQVEYQGRLSPTATSPTTAAALVPDHQVVTVLAASVADELPAKRRLLGTTIRYFISHFVDYVFLFLSSIRSHLLMFWFVCFYFFVFIFLVAECLLPYNAFLAFLLCLLSFLSFSFVFCFCVCCWCCCFCIAFII